MIHGPKILIVDSEPTIARLLLMILETHGYQVGAALSASEAWEKISADIDLVLLDITLSDSDGLKVCHLLKTNLQTKHIPVIILSSGARKGEQLESFHLGADDYLHKPIEPEELFARVAAVLSRSHKNSPPPIDRAYELVQELNHIIDEEKMTPYFQPIYLLKPLRLFGLEVLSRPQTNGIFASPEALFKAALRFGRYPELEMIVWRQAVAVAQRVLSREHLFLNCNPSLIEDLPKDMIKAVFQDFDMTRRHVFLEITERYAIGEYDLFLQHLAEYRDFGFKIAVDDVGAGYASLDAIIHTRPEVVKIDCKIVSGIMGDPYKKSIVKLMVEFCRENGIICIAEGIETKKELEMLIDLGVHAGQGFYLHKPTAQVNIHDMRAITL